MSVAKHVLVGAGVGGGVAIAPALIWLTPSSQLRLSTELGQRIGFARVLEVFEMLHQEFEADSAGPDANAEAKEVLAALAVILRDPKLLESIKARLAEGADAATAIRGAFDSFGRALTALGGYFAERAADLNSLADRAVAVLSGADELHAQPIAPVIIVADRLSPLEVSQLDPALVKGIVTIEGGVTSHTAVMARAHNLPAVLGAVGARVIENGQMLLLDSSSGQIFVDPGTDEITTYRSAVGAEVTADLTPARVPLMANIGSSSEGRAAILAGAEGVGLYRSELMFLGRRSAPSLEEQVFEYSRLFARFKGKTVVARMLDLDTDKPLPFLVPAGEGRYFGRGLSTLLANEAVLDTQLAALASAQGYYPQTTLWVMAPMVTEVWQAAQFGVRARAAGLKVIGAMVEVPELTSDEVLDELLQHVDFLSIGTNDLTQYTLGIERGTQLNLMDAIRPELLEQIARVINAGLRHQKPVSICGEIAGEPEAASLFIDMGVSGLSASPALLPALRRRLRAD